MTLTIAALSLSIGLLLGLLGGGGSILTVPMLVYLAQLEPKNAIATSLLVVGITSAFALLPHARMGKICWRAGAFFGAASMAGAYLGGRMAAWLPGHVLLLLFAGMMLVTAIAMLSKRKDARTESSESGVCPTGVWVLLLIALQGVFVGALTGLVGAGGGFLVVPALTLLGGLPMHAAIGTSLLIVALNSFAGLAGYLNHVQIDFIFAGGVTALTVVGSLAGSLLAPHVSASVLRRGFALFVIAVAFYLLHREWGLAAMTQNIERHQPLWLGVAAGLGAVLLHQITKRMHKKTLTDKNGSNRVPY